MNLQDKTILITGANGLVGLPTIKKCINEGAGQIIAVDIKIGSQLTNLASEYPNRVKVLNKDLTYLHNCEDLFHSKVDVVLHLAGIKGNPTKAKTQPADYLFPMLMFNTNVIKTAFEAEVDWFVYTSSVGVYQPSDVMIESDVWKTMPSQNDWYPGWSKRMGELTVESLAIQYGWKNWTMIRPSNIYGPNDNISPEATIIGSNVWKVFNTPGSEIECWGDGSPRRDFVYSEDVADAVVEVVKKEVNDVINFGCGEAVSIKDTVGIIVDCYEQLTGQRKKITWDTSKPNGDMLRSLSTEKQRSYDIMPKTGLKEGIYSVLKTYKDLM